MTATDPRRLLEKKVQEMQAFLDFGQAVAGPVAPEEIVRRLALTISGQWALRTFGIVIRREGREPLVRQRGLPSLEDTARTPVGTADPFAAIGSEPRVLGTPSPEPALLGSLSAGGARALVPLASGGTVRGLVALGDRPGGAPWDADALAHVSGLGSQALLALEAAWQREETEELRRRGERREGRVTVGGYEILERIGAGGMAEVFRARSLADGTEAAVKLIAEDRTDQPRMRRRFEREGEIVARISHPNIVRLLSRGEHGGRLYLAMELLSGEPVSQAVRRRPFALPEALRALRQIGSALSLLHASDVVHRDVKTSNIMRTPGGDFVLLDFGLARDPDSRTLTGSEEVVGTVAYLAPEVIRGGDAVAATDVWALGIVFLEMLSGRRPWGPLEGFPLALSILESRPELPPQLTAPGKGPFLRLAEAMLVPEPSSRIRDGAALLAALDALPETETSS